MGCTIARTAGKRATSPLRTTVGTDAKSIRLQVDADTRLAAAVGGAARYLADAAGLENEAVSQLQSAILAACRQAFDHLSGPHPRLSVTFAGLPDRIEITFEHEGEPAPAMGVDTAAEAAGSAGDHARRLNVMAGVDRVQYERRGGLTVTRLTKYISQSPPGK
jgi:hypothetical protein